MAALVTTYISVLNVFNCRSFFQSVCVLGYCVLPLTIALIICQLVLLVQQSTLMFVIRCLIVLIAFGWSTFGKSLVVTELANYLFTTGCPRMNGLPLGFFATFSETVPNFDTKFHTYIERFHLHLHAK